MPQRASHIASASFMVDPDHAGQVHGYVGLHITYRRL
jgi:hypothetical protein